MKRQIRDIYLFSDVDGTFLQEGRPLAARNVEAIRRFVARGGHFAFATGRSCLTIRDLYEQVHGNAPCIIHNGGSIYDMQTQTMLWNNVLPPNAHRYLSEILQAYPAFAAFAITDTEYASVAAGDPAVIRHHVRASVTAARRIEEIDGVDWYKLLFVVPPGCAQQTIDALSRRYPDVDFMQSSQNYVEMLPKGISKGTALIEYMRRFGIERQHVAAIGDLYNDLAMLQLAGISAAPADAAPEICQAVQQVFCRCDDGAVADLIEYIESICE